MTREITRELARFVANTRYEDLPRPVIEHARKCVADTIGVMVAGQALGRGVREVVQTVAADGGHGEATVIGEEQLRPVRGAALANGSMTHQYDFDDTHDRAVVHPTANSLPVTMALAERSDADYRSLLEAVVVGNEVACRLGLGLTGLLFDHPWVRPPVLGMFGAVAAGARLLGMAQHEVANAWGLLLPRVGGTLACLVEPGSWVRTMRDGFSADSAVLALQLANAGVKGERHPFDGPYGLYHAYFKGEYDPDVVVDRLGAEFRCEDVSLKPWPCCREVHGTLTALFDALASTGARAKDIAGVHILVGDTNLKLCEPGPVRRHPKHVTDALCNIPFNVALGAIHGRIPLHAYTATGLTDPQLASMADRVTWEHDPQQVRAGTLEPGAIQLRLADGRVHESVAEISRGDPRRPLTDEQAEEKYRECFQVSAALDEASGKKLLELLHGSDVNVPVSQLMKHLRPRNGGYDRSATD